MWSSSSDSISESESAELTAWRARACERPESLEAVEKLVSGRPEGTRTSGVATAVLSPLVNELDELLGGVTSELFFLVMFNARTGPSVAVL